MPLASYDKIHFRKQKTFLMHIYPGCNFHCKFCMAEDEIKHSPRPDWDHLMQDLDRLKEEGHVNIDIAGGEPTLYTRLPDLIGEIQQRGMNAMICTNGSILSNPKMVQEYARHRPLGIELSFHSHKPDVFDMATKVKGSFQKAVKAIDVLHDHFAFYPQGDEPREFLTTNTIITQYNYKDLEDIVAFLHNKGIQIMRFSLLKLEGTALKERGMLVTAQAMIPYLQKALKTAKALGVYYALDTLPLCILPGEEEHFVTRAPAGIKLGFCQACELNGQCNGIPKTLLVAEYGAQLLSSLSLFPPDFFTPEEIEFLKNEP